MKILIADLFSKTDLTDLETQGFKVHYDDKLNGEALLKVMNEFQPQILVVRSTKVTKDHLIKGLEAVIRAGSGYDTIDVKSANEKGIFVANCPGKNAVAVAELAMGLIVSVDRRIPENVMQLKNKEWNKGEFCKSDGLKGKTVGIIGFGSIGKALAERALAFEMNVLIKGGKRPVEFSHPNAKVLNDADELLKNSDFVSLNVPSTESTKNMVNAAFLSKMKKTACLVNTSRGNLVVEADLLAHLEANTGFWFAADVFVGEPTDKKGAFDCKLAQHPRVYGTHHIGASTKQSEAAVGQEATRMIVEYNKTKVLPNVVNMAKKNPENSNVIVKFVNNPSMLAKIFDALQNVQGKVCGCNVEVFEGGVAALATITVEKLGDKQGTLDAELKKIEGIVDFAISN